MIASHSGVLALCASTRNLPDEPIDASGASGGLNGIVFAVAFLRADGRDDAETPLDTLIAHAAMSPTGSAPSTSRWLGLRRGDDPRTLGDAAGLPRLLQALGDGGFSAAEVRAIAWETWRRALARAWSG